MAGIRRIGATVAAMAMAALLVGVASSQTGPPTTGPSTKPNTKIRQPAEFLALAAKAAKSQAIYVRGVGILEGELTEETPKEARQEAGFEVWVKDQKAHIRPDPPILDERVSDGKWVYVYHRDPEGQASGSRKRLTQKNLYSTLSFAGIILDATQGYANLAAGAQLVPTKAESGLAEKFPKLTWFRITQARGEPHAILSQCDSVTLGFSSVDGIVRVAVGRQRKGELPVTKTVVFRTIRLGKVEDKDLKLPPKAALAKWTDGDREDKRRIAVPKAVIAKP